MALRVWRKIIAVLALLTAMTLLLAACGSGGSSSGQGSSSSAPAVDTALAKRGEALFKELSCNTCHGIKGEKLTGPPLNGIYGKQVELEDGSKVTVDDAYLRESILQPDAKIVKGYPAGVMTAIVQGEMDKIQQDDNVNALVEYIKSLK